MKPAKATTLVRDETGPALPVARCPEPDYSIGLWNYRPPKGDRTIAVSEETGTIWLWAFPQLLGWPCSIAWLYAPVTGKRSERPGDLWGIDEEGQLIVVEAKAVKPGSACDPFADFLIDGEAFGRGRLTRRHVAADAVRAHWEKKLSQEREFVKRRLAVYDDGR